MDDTDRNAPASKGDIAGSEERVMARRRDNETKLLSAIYCTAVGPDRRPDHSPL